MKKWIIRVVTMVLVLAAIATGYYYGYYTPARQDGAYNAALVNTTSAVMDDSAHLLETASLPIFNDLNELPAVCLDNAKKVTDSVNQFNKYLNDLEKIAAVSQPAYAYGLTRDAAKTSARKLRAEAMVKQSRQVIAGYMALTEYLRALAEIRKEYVDITAPLTTVIDLNEYFYRTQELRDDADKIDMLASRVKLVNAPAGLSALRDQIAALYIENAAGYRDLADGLAIGSDINTDIAAHRIEAATAKLETDIQNQYATFMKDSAVIKELGELPDKYTIE